MIKVHIFSGDEILGWSELWALDPPMGVAEGVFHPLEPYWKIQPLMYAWSEREYPTDEETLKDFYRKIDLLKLKVVTEDGVHLEAVGGIQILDGRNVPEDSPIIVLVAGMDCFSGLYERYFGQDPHYRSYWGLDRD